MSTIRKHATLSVTAAIAALLLLLAGGASTLTADRGTAAAHDNAYHAATGESQAGAVDSTCGESAVDQSKSAKPCKTCPEKPYCTCTYNGQPRVSCEPCCYLTRTGEICFD